MIHAAWTPTDPLCLAGGRHLCDPTDHHASAGMTAFLVEEDRAHMHAHHDQEPQYTSHSRSKKPHHTLTR